MKKIVKHLFNLELRKNFKWKKQFELWEDDGNDIDNDFIKEIGTTAEPKKLLNKINKLIEEHYECSTY